MKPVKAWIGVVEGSPDCEIRTDEYGPYDHLAVYMKKAAAKARYQDVVRVEIKEVKKRAKKNMP